jgi:hypothetical protein
MALSGSGEIQLHQEISASCGTSSVSTAKPIHVHELEECEFLDQPLNLLQTVRVAEVRHLSCSDRDVPDSVLKRFASFQGHEESVHFLHGQARLEIEFEL